MRLTTPCLAALLVTTLSLSAKAQAEASDPAVAFIDSLPTYAPKTQVSGTIRLWGHGSPKHDFMGKLVTAWIADFKKLQPDVTFENHMYGTASAIGALYTGAGDIALMGEEISPMAEVAFEREKGYAPAGFQIATGSLDVNYFDYAHMVYVNRANPVDHLSLSQLDAIFGAEHRRGPKSVRTWGELGLSGDWSQHRIQPYGWESDVDFGLFFREAVLQGSHRWNTDYKEYNHVLRPDGTQYDSGKQILDTLASDPYGIAISNVRYENANVRALALSREDGGPYYQPTKANLISQDYPLVRIIPAFIDRPPGKAIEPKEREFLLFILSRQGQKDLIEDSDYLPLSKSVNLKEQEELK